MYIRKANRNGIYRLYYLIRKKLALKKGAGFIVIFEPIATF